MGDNKPKAFVCGHPISHARSPMIHTFWLRQYAIAGSYAAVDIAPADFAGFVDRLAEAGYRGGNVTIPHKEAAFDLVARRDEAADLIGAVNTLWLDEGIVCGANTDAYGFAANLDDRAPGWDESRSAVVLGAGGAARAVIHALKQRGIAEIRVANRTGERAIELSHRFGASVSAHSLDALREVCGDADLLVNTTSLGMAGQGVLSADPDWLPDHARVADIVYVPLQTPLLRSAARRGLATVDGLGMLLHQAVPGFERWFGRRPTVSPGLRALIEADLGEKV